MSAPHKPGLSPVPQHPSPPFPHDPYDRCWMAEIDGWQVRVMAANDPRRRVCVKRGLMHLQLYNAESRVSILTASKLTRGRIEVWSAAGVARCCCSDQLSRFLRERYGLVAPDWEAVSAFERLFVHLTYLGASL